jgi:hypothetical protein
LVETRIESYLACAVAIRVLIILVSIR